MKKYPLLIAVFVGIILTFATFSELKAQNGIDFSKLLRISGTATGVPSQGFSSIPFHRVEFNKFRSTFEKPSFVVRGSECRFDKGCDVALVVIFPETQKYVFVDNYHGDYTPLGEGGLYKHSEPVEVSQKTISEVLVGIIMVNGGYGGEYEIQATSPAITKIHQRTVYDNTRWFDFTVAGLSEEWNSRMDNAKINSKCQLYGQEAKGCRNSLQSFKNIFVDPRKGWQKGYYTANATHFRQYFSKPQKLQKSTWIEPNMVAVHRIDARQNHVYRIAAVGHMNKNLNLTFIFPERKQYFVVGRKTPQMAYTFTYQSPVNESIFVAVSSTDQANTKYALNLRTTHQSAEMPEPIMFKAQDLSARFANENFKAVSAPQSFTTNNVALNNFLYNNEYAKELKMVNDARAKYLKHRAGRYSIVYKLFSPTGYSNEGLDPDFALTYFDVVINSQSSDKEAIKELAEYTKGAVDQSNSVLEERGDANNYFWLAEDFPKTVQSYKQSIERNKNTVYRNQELYLAKSNQINGFLDQLSNEVRKFMSNVNNQLSKNTLTRAEKLKLIQDMTNTQFTAQNTLDGVKKQINTCLLQQLLSNEICKQPPKIITNPSN